MSFAACDDPKPCGPQGMKSHYLLDLLARVEGGMRRAVAAGRTPLILQLGAATLGNTAVFADLDLYRKVHSLLPGDVQESYKIVLVEPNLVLFDELKSNAEKLPVDERRVKIVNSMVRDWCTQDGVTKMYRFTRAIESDFGVQFSMLGTWLSTDRSFPLTALRLYLRGRVGLPTQAVGRLRQLNNSANASSYVTEIQVPCHTPSTLLKAAGIEASNLVMVIIDAEGADEGIVKKLVGLPGFMPAYLQWEGKLDSREHPGMVRLANNLRARGFHVGQVYPAGDSFVSDADNIVALL